MSGVGGSRHNTEGLGQAPRKRGCARGRLGSIRPGTAPIQLLSCWAPLRCAATCIPSRPGSSDRCSAPSAAPPAAAGSPACRTTPRRPWDRHPCRSPHPPPHAATAKAQVTAQALANARKRKPDSNLSCMDRMRVILPREVGREIVGRDRHRPERYYPHPARPYALRPGRGHQYRHDRCTRQCREH